MPLGYIVGLALVILAVSNAYFAFACRASQREKVNALGTLLIAAEGAFSESTHILNLTVEKRRIDFKLWDVLQQDLIWQSRLYPAIASLDMRHKQSWMRVQDSIVALEQVASSVKQAYASVFVQFLNLTDGQTIQIATVRNLVVTIGTNAFPERVTLGANPEAAIPDENILRAAEAAARLICELEKLQQCMMPNR
jgi:hypothetical protein